MTESMLNNDKKGGSEKKVRHNINSSSWHLKPVSVAGGNTR